MNKNEERARKHAKDFYSLQFERPESINVLQKIIRKFSLQRMNKNTRRALYLYISLIPCFSFIILYGAENEDKIKDPIKRENRAFSMFFIYQPKRKTFTLDLNELLKFELLIWSTIRRRCPSIRFSCVW